MNRAGSTQHPSRKTQIVTGLVLFFSVWVFWIVFPTGWITFYRDDNVVSSAPLLVDAAKSLARGALPLRTSSVGGGGGIDLVGSLHPGALNPFALLPAWILGSRPELMTNVMISLHVALFALGGWFMAVTMRAPGWAGIISGISLGFSGCFVVWAGNWLSVFLPYTAIPWVLAGFILICRATSIREQIIGHAIAGVALFCLFYSGSLHGALFGGLAVTACMTSWIVSTRPGLRSVAVRLAPQAIWFVVAIVPLLWRSSAVFAYSGAALPDVGAYRALSIPFDAYSGLFVPGSSTVWKVPWLPSKPFTNMLLSFGAIPAWFILFTFIRRPQLVKIPAVIPLIVAVLLFVALMSPHDLGLSQIFHDTLILNLFSLPFRGIPAFHVLLLFLFATLTLRLDNPLNRTVQIFLVAATIFCGTIFLTYDVTRIHAKGSVSSWFQTNDYFSNRDRLKDATLKRLQQSGYVMSLSRPNDAGPYRWVPAIFLHGNMGAQFGIKTVHFSLPGLLPSAYRSLGMNGRGQVLNWPKVKEFIERSPQTPPAEKPRWANRIGPKDFNELVAKTHVGGIIVQSDWKEVLNYFMQSPAWTRLEQNRFAWVFVRTPAK